MWSGAERGGPEDEEYSRGWKMERGVGGYSRDLLYSSMGFGAVIFISRSSAGSSPLAFACSSGVIVRSLIGPIRRQAGQAGQ